MGMRRSLFLIFFFSGIKKVLPEEGERRGLMASGVVVARIECALKSLHKEGSVDGEIVRRVRSELKRNSAIEFIGTGEEKRGLALPILRSRLLSSNMPHSHSE